MSNKQEHNEIREIADAICDENVSSEQLKRLEELLSNNPSGKQFYLHYLAMHVRLSSEAQSNLEFVYRRMTEEVVVRSADNKPVYEGETKESLPDAGQHIPPNEITEQNDNIESAQKSSHFSKLNLVLFALMLLCSALGVWSLLEHRSAPEVFSAKIVQGSLSISNFGRISNDTLYSGEYKTQQETVLNLNTGERVTLVPQTHIKFFNVNEMELIQGAIAIERKNPRKLIVHGSKFSIYDKYTDLALDLRSTNPIVKTGNNTVLIPNRWRPKHYWSFDGQADRAIDSAGNADGIVHQKVMKAEGLIGDGSFFFDNTSKARINLGSGGGIAPATGSFAVTDGITIEALVAPNYSGLEGDMDEIFRKDQKDKHLRVLLSLQNNSWNKRYARPEGIKHKSISFGLFILGQGYRELLLPLDGKNGRPTLDELNSGKPFHIVATYDVKSGVKAIYINGQQGTRWTYPKGSKMLSGGEGNANIGNSPNRMDHRKDAYAGKKATNEAFSGIIDEVAFYDFALSPFMVQQHYSEIKQQRNYFGFKPSTESLPKEIKLRLPSNTSIEINATTGLPHKRVE